MPSSGEFSAFSPGANARRRAVRNCALRRPARPTRSTLVGLHAQHQWLPLQELPPRPDMPRERCRFGPCLLRNEQRPPGPHGADRRSTPPGRPAGTAAAQRSPARARDAKPDPPLSALASPRASRSDSATPRSLRAAAPQGPPSGLDPAAPPRQEGAREDMKNCVAFGLAMSPRNRGRPDSSHVFP